MKTGVYKKGKRGRKRMFILFFFLIMIFVLAGFFNPVETVFYEVNSDKLPEAFNGFKIIQISDYHCKEFRKNGTDFYQYIKQQSPDIIVLTGDQINGTSEDFPVLENFLEQLTSIAPCYAISGNHDRDHWDVYVQLKEIYNKYGVSNLDQSMVELHRKGQTISLYGAKWDALSKHEISAVSGEKGYRILLYHNANEFGEVSKYGYNLILTGHTHGGVIRIPFVGGVISNDGKRVLFPAYDGGMYKVNGSTMICSKGIGDADIPRFYNRREITCITLKK